LLVQAKKGCALHGSGANKPTLRKQKIFVHSWQYHSCIRGNTIRGKVKVWVEPKQLLPALPKLVLRVRLLAFLRIFWVCIALAPTRCPLPKNNTPPRMPHIESVAQGN
jgi:hypothetical protein